MPQDSRGHLSARPAFLPATQVPYDGLPGSPEGFAEAPRRRYGCAV